jgi:hypothetical protein
VKKYIIVEVRVLMALEGIDKAVARASHVKQVGDVSFDTWDEAAEHFDNTDFGSNSVNTCILCVSA